MTTFKREVKVLKQKLKEKELAEKALQEENLRLRSQLRSENERDDKQSRFEEDLKNKIECPVCLEVPRRGPVPVCPNGHLVCQNCKRDTCPVCRSNMGNGKSILAGLVIEHLEYSCKHEACGEKFTVLDIEEHEVNCKLRKVVCPNLDCEMEVTLLALIDHLASNDSGCCYVGEISGFDLGEWVRQFYTIPDLSQGDLKWPLYICEIQGLSNFVLLLTNSERQVFFSTIMLASEEVSSQLAHSGSESCEH